METETSKIASNTVAQIIGRVFVLAIALISVKLITNYLGPEGTGYYNTIVTYLSFFIVLADFGFFSVAVREISKYPERTKEILSNIFTIRFISATLAVLIALAIAFLTNYPLEIKYGVAIAALFPIFNLASSVYDMLFQARLKMSQVALAEVISKVIALIGVYCAVVLNLGFYYIVATISLAAVLNFVIKAILSARELNLSLVYNSKIIKEITKMSLPFGIVFIVNNLYFRIDSLILFYFKGPYDTGIYSVSYKVLETTLFAGTYLASSLKPLLSKAVTEDKPRAEKALTQGITFLLFMALIITSICVAFSKEIILFISNDQFLSGAPILVILAFAALLIYLNGLFGEIMIALDLRKTLLKISIFILTFNVLLNIILIPRYSYFGAAWATTISEAILLIFGYFVAKKIINVYFDFRRLGKLVLIATVLTILAFILKSTGINFLLNISLLLTSYCLLAYFTNAVPRVLINQYFDVLKDRWKK